MIVWWDPQTGRYVMKRWTALLLFLGVGALGAVAWVEQEQKPAPLPPKWSRIHWEAEAQPIDTIVIHHTAAKRSLTRQELSDIEKDRIYGAFWKTGGKDPVVRGWPVQSGHFWIVDGRKVEHFCTYHWIVRADGTAERLLWDDERGWHAGDWDVNMESIGIVLDGDFTTTKPPKGMLDTVAQIVKAYSQKEKRQLDIVGHKQVKATECPGKWWNKDVELLLVARGLNLEPYPITVSAP